MNEEINKDFYCTCYYMPRLSCPIKARCVSGIAGSECEHLHRKYPTPQQYEEEYGVEYPNNGAYIRAHFHNEDQPSSWIVDIYEEASSLSIITEELILDTAYRKIDIVCACTPWGCPPLDWEG